MISEGNVFRVLSLGDLVADLTVSISKLPVEANAHQIVHRFQLEPGGAGNFLIAGARLGMKMTALGTIGDDVFGQAVLDLLVEQGVAIEGVIHQTDASSTTVIVLVDDMGQHVFLGGYGVGPAIEFPARWKRLLDSCDAVFVSGYTFHEHRLAHAALETMKRARKTKIPVFFDPGPDMVRLQAEQREEILANSDLLLLTEQELPILTGGEDGIDAARMLLNEKVVLVCVKRGERGCVIFTEEEKVEHPGFKVIVRDTTAAGDSFAAAFIFGYLQEWSLPQIATFANAMGAAKVQKIGSGSQVPSAEEVRAVLEKYEIKLDF